MPDIKAVYEKYANIDIGDLSSNQKDAMREILRAMQPEELKSMREHEMFVELLHKFRLSVVKDFERVGDNFLKTMQSLLAVGEDGVYSNSHRFIYELVKMLMIVSMKRLMIVTWIFSSNVIRHQEKLFLPTMRKALRLKMFLISRESRKNLKIFQQIR